ncbi:choice-of-anchor D domain-containing protein, partial [bacterium]|nr:choice-of-anchor D domain-containing protein [bacterium]
MKRLLILFLSVLTLGFVMSAQAEDIVVSLPDLTVNPGETIEIPITTEMVSASDSCLGYQTLITWDPAIGNADSAIRGPLISPSWIPTWNFNVPGEANGGYWFFMAPYLSGAGDLGYLRFTVDANAQPGATSALHFDYFLWTMAPSLNAVMIDGSITIASPAFPELVWEPSNFGFTVEFGGSDQDLLTLGNIGDADLNYALSTSGETWLSLGAFSGLIAPGGSEDVDVFVDAAGLAPDTYTAEIYIESDDPANPLVTIPVEMIVSAPPPPELTWTPDNFDFTVAYGGSDQDLLSLGNDGGTAVNYTLSTSGETWLSFGAWSGSIAAGGSEDVDVMVDASGLAIGTYNAEIYLDSDDPANPNVIIPVTMLVQAPVLGWDPVGFSFTLYIGETDEDVLELSNTGNINLNYTMSTDGSPWLSIGTWSGLIAPGGGENVPIYVSAAGLTSGIYYGHVYIDSDDPVNPNVDVQVTMMVEEIPAPIMTWAPHDFYFTVNINGSTQDILTVGNDGNADLTYTLSTSGETWLSYGQYTGTVTSLGSEQVDILINAAGLAAGTYNAELYIDSNDPANPNVIIPVQLTVLAPELAWDPQSFSFSILYPGGTEQDVLDVINNGLGDLEYSLSTSGEAWLTLGTYTGFVPQGNSEQVDVYVDATGLAIGNYNATIYINSNDPNNPQVTIPVQLEVYGEANLSWSPQNFDFSVLIGGGDQDLLNLVNDGLGALSYTLSTSGEAWLSLGTWSGWINPGMSEDVDVFVDASALGVGTYNAEIYLDSNDPANPNVTIPVTLNVYGEPNLSWSPQNFDFTIEYGGSDQDVLGLTNDGTAALTYTLSTSGEAWLSLGTWSGSIPAASGEDVDVLVDGTGLAVGTYNAEIYLVSDDPTNPNVTIPVTLEVTGEPELTWNPSSFSFTLYPEGSDQDVLELGNNGPVDLTYTLSTSGETWLSLGTWSGSIAGFGSEDVDVFVDAAGLSPGIFSADIYLNSNDPVNPSVTIPVTMVVQNADPTVTILTPPETGASCDLEYLITWEDEDLNDDAFLDFFYSSSPDPNFATIIDYLFSINEDDPADEWMWNTANVPNGDYYVLAMIYDEWGGFTYDYSGMLTVQHPSPPVLTYTPQSFYMTLVA